MDFPPRRLLFAFSLLFCTAVCGGAAASEANWIWAPGANAGDAVDVGDGCRFRKPINLRKLGEAFVEVAADDDFQLRINGRPVGGGTRTDGLVEFDVTDQIEVGRNVVAIEVVNRRGHTAAMAARVSIRPNGDTNWYTFSSDGSWKAEPFRAGDRPAAGWDTTVLNDSAWGPAAVLGQLGQTAPWDTQPSKLDADPAPIAAASPAPPAGTAQRMQVQKGFAVQRLLGDDQVGSVIAMAFDEFGQMILSTEAGPLLVASDTDEDGIFDDVREYCTAVVAIQGILPLNGEVIVTGMVEGQSGLFRLADQDRDGVLELVATILKFKGNGGEHGPHGIRLGPDGMIYVSLGSHVSAIGPAGRGDTLRDVYEGDLLPRYEDPGGHAAGIKAPGGTIIRTDIEGNVVERIAGGLRNVYDLAFHPDGSLLVHDADMEADQGTPWYRPTALLDVAEAGEFGWRAGWSKWPEHYHDRLPTLLETGRGSPTGIEIYEHHMYPVRYQNSVFLADWSEGRILNVRLKRAGSGYVADSEVFLRGQPLNVTDLAVGPDGSLYFTTGGRGTAGGVYRVVYAGKVPEAMTRLGTGVAAAIRQPQIDSAWARQAIASIHRELGDDWRSQIVGVAYSRDNPDEYRLRALTLMQMYGPIPSDDLIIELSEDRSEAVRRRVAMMMGGNPSARTGKRLAEMLADPASSVRRAAGEAILRADQMPTNVADVLPLIDGTDRTTAFVGRQILQRIPVEQWRDLVLNAKNPRRGIVGMTALVAADPSPQTGRAVIGRVSGMIEGFLSDADFIDTLRLTELALSRCPNPPTEFAEFGKRIAVEFPSGDSRMNQELIRIACYLQQDEMVGRAIRFLESEAELDDRVIVAMCLQRLDRKWVAKERFALLKFYEQVAAQPPVADDSGTGALPMYMMAATRDFARHLSPADLQAILNEGARWRNAALAAIYRLPHPIDGETAEKLRELDRRLDDDPTIDDVKRRLRTGVIAMLASAGDAESTEHLRKIWRTDPERRAVVALALAQSPGGDNWDYLVRSLHLLEGPAGNEVVQRLSSVEIATDDPDATRALVLMGLRREKNGESIVAVEALLEHWTQMQRPPGARAVDAAVGQVVRRGVPRPPTRRVAR